MLYRRGEIIQKLRQLSKKNSLMTLHFGENSMLSTVVDVLTDKSLLVLDYGGNEDLNQLLLKKDRAVVKTDLDGITAQFTISNIRKARLQGKPSFACPIPENILWVQRREFYRVKVPLSETVTCEIFHADGSSTLYPVLDVSTGGIGLLDKDNTFALETDTVFNSCKLSLGAHGSSVVSIEIRGLIPMNPNDSSAGTRCGCSFKNLSGEFETELQKFINFVDLQQKRVE